MKRIELEITARSPLAIGQRKPGGSVSEASDYIPGTVIRGAVAAQMLRCSEDTPTPGDDFHKLFLNETAAIFSDGYCAIATIEDPNSQTLHHVVKEGDIRVVPASALSSKTKGGFKPESGVFDSLIDSFCARAHGHFYTPEDLDGNLADAFSGFYSVGTENGTPRYYSHTLSKRLLTRVGINRRRATAQDEMLYSIEVMDESHPGKQQPVSTVYRSSILVRDDEEALGESFGTFVKERCQNLRLGGSASRGLGKVEIAVVSETVIDEAKSNHKREIEQRILSFNRKLKERWQLWGALGEAPANLPNEQLFFTIGFQSDAILKEGWQRTTVISPEMISSWLDEKGNYQLHAAYTSYGYRSGWNAAWGLPKDTELVTNRGSVLLFGISEINQDALYEKLSALEREGIGEKCAEGYGRVTVCDPFHEIMRERAV